jgi:hypothetical protein
MRINANSDGDLRRSVTVYLNGVKEPNAFEVYIPGNILEGQGYVVRGVTKDGKQVATVDLTEPLPPGQYDCEGALCEKVFGRVRVEIGDDATQFEDN